MKININGNTVEIEDEVISKAIEEKTESIDIKSDELVIRSKADEATFSENKRTEGISVGAEIGRKEVIKGLGIDVEGSHKSDKLSIKAIQEHSTGLVTQALEDAKIEPNTKIAEKDKDIATLKTTIETLTGQNTELNKNFSSFKNTQLINSSLMNEIPDNVLLPKGDTLTLMGTKMKLDVDDKGVVFGVGPDGQPIKDDTTLEKVPVKTLVANFFNDNEQLLKKADGGAGGGDSGDGSGKQNLEDFTKEMQEAGHPVNGVEFVRIMNERIKADTLAV